MEKSEISWDFQRQFHGKNSQFCGKFMEIFGANFADKQSVKNGQFCGNFLGKFCWKAIGFALFS